MDKTKNKIIKKLHRKDYGRACTFSDFTNLADDATLRRALAELIKEGKISEVSPDIFVVFGKSEFIDAPIPPAASSIAYAITRQHGWVMLPEKWHTLNYVGFESQVPCRFIYGSSGPDITFDVLGVTIEFRHIPENLQRYRTIGEAAIAYILLSNEYPKYYRRKFLKRYCPPELVAEIAKELNVQIP